MKLYLRLKGGRPQIDIELAALLRACSTGLLEVAPLASKRGAKGDLNHHFFAQSLVQVAVHCKASLKLPSRSTKEEFAVGLPTPFFAFAQRALAIAVSKGEAAITNSVLPDMEKLAALTRILDASKSYGGVLELLYRARRSNANSGKRKGP